MPKKKKETQKEAYGTLAEAIAKLRKSVPKELKKQKKKKEAKSKPKPKPKSKKKVPDTKRTKDVKRQLRKSLSEADIKRLQDKKKDNPHKKRGGY